MYIDFEYIFLYIDIGFSYNVISHANMVQSMFDSQCNFLVIRGMT